MARCVGCGACVLACRIENRTPVGVSWRRVIQVNRDRIGGWPTYHLSVACHHCQDPPCAQACPSGALHKDQDGLVLLNPNRCIGCRYCQMACPFGAPSFNPESGLMTKCHLCHHRLKEGLPPACVAACPTQALGFSPPMGDSEPEKAEEGDGRRFDAADEVPGFGDPWSAGPGFWVAEPAGALRSEWYRQLRDIMLPKKGDPLEPA